MNIGYYPIKKKEILEIIKMVRLYKRKDYSSLDEIFKQHNVNQKKKEDVLKSFEECIKNSDELLFNKSYGLCIAKVQKIYRGNFIFKEKSITNLIQDIPELVQYRTPFSDFIKSDKYKFFPELKITNSSGAYISYENIKKIRNNYDSNISLKAEMNNYYGTDINKFIEVLDYCIENECGLLEANFSVEKVQVLEQNIKMSNNSLEGQTNIEYSNSQNNTGSSKNKRLVSVMLKTWTIIGWHVLAGFVGLIVSGIFTAILALTTNGSIILNFVISTIVSIITTFLMWWITIKLAFIETTIDKNKISVLVRNIAIYIAVLLLLNSFLNFYDYSSEINKLVNNEVANNQEIWKEQIMVSMLGSREDQKNFENKVSELKEEAKKEVTKQIIPYYIGATIISGIINFSALPYIKRKIKKVA